VRRVGTDEPSLLPQPLTAPRPPAPSTHRLIGRSPLPR
jgi:hypothetical protein